MLQTLVDNLKKRTSKTVHIKLNNNKSHYFVLKDYKKSIWLSLHNFFLEAPTDVINALLSYIITKKKEHFILIRRFIYSNQSRLDFSNQIDKSKLQTKGDFFDLQVEFDSVNQMYFKKRLDLNITWFKPSYKKFRYITFGSYDRQCKLIRINKYLDHKDVDQTYIKYLIFHEMLHEVYPTEILNNGRCQMHSKAFKEHEKKFPNFNKMKEFEKFFMKNLWRKNGRT